jgi:peptidoglycan/xylan/chitin deacetylase (PgdA/CDA1 family)
MRCGRAALFSVALLAAFAPAAARAHATRTGVGVPILMYHIVADPPAHAVYTQLYVRPRDFRLQMAWLARHGYHAVTLDRVYEDWRGTATLPRNPVVISFDDGYLSQYTRAFPVLQRRRWPGVLNMEVNFLASVGGLLPWRVRNLIGAGWEVDAHTLTHPDLTTLSPAELWRQVHGSRVRLRGEFHVPVSFFCYPDGRYDSAVVAAVRRAGFLGATTTTYGLARPPAYYALDRIRINRSDGLTGFAQKLTALVPSS